MPFIMVTVLIDMVSIGLIIPVLPPLVGSFTGDTTEQTLWYGVTTFAFSIANFVGSPILGALIGAVAFLGIVYPISWMRARAAKKEFDPPLVPFGVFLAPAAVIALLWGERVITAYSRYSGL